jgi:TetR/AcrR family transcriptional repressor of mexJK operon
LFLKEGYSGTNLQQVAVAAGVTKPTVYSHFKSKEGLLQAVTACNAEIRAIQLSLVLRPSDDPRADLVRFGDLLLSKVLSKEARLWDRLAAAESLEHPEVGEAFFRAGPVLVLRRLGIYLKHQQRAGLLEVPHPQRAAEQFVGLLLGMDLLRSQVGQEVLRPAQRSRRCREAVDVFLSAYSVRNQ